MLGLTTVATLGVSAFQANSQAREAQKQMTASAKVSEAQRTASVASTLSQVRGIHKQVESLEKSKSIMGIQGKADRVSLLEEYNDIASTQVVMGVASGRVLGSGSLQTIYSKSQSDYMWDKLWSLDSTAITLGAIGDDQVNLLDASNQTLLGSIRAMEVQELSNTASYQNTQSQIDNQITNLQTSMFTTALKGLDRSTGTLIYGGN